MTTSKFPPTRCNTCPTLSCETLPSWSTGTRSRDDFRRKGGRGMAAGAGVGVRVNNPPPRHDSPPVAMETSETATEGDTVARGIVGSGWQ